VGPAAMSVEQRPAYYALESGGWRDYVTLLHPPYTLWHLSYVVIGAALAPKLPVERLLLGLVAFFLALGIGAHALDELNGRPLRTAIPDRTLAVLAIASVGAATALGLAASFAWTLWLLPFVVFGTFIVAAYNLELVGGRFHSDLWFGIAWGALPVLTAYVGAAETLRPEALLAAAFAAFLSLAQRQLSTQVRTIRRKTDRVSGAITHAGGREEPITEETLIRAPEAALRLLVWAVVAVALALLVLRVG
jgi:hypothetical protein